MFQLHPTNFRMVWNNCNAYKNILDGDRVAFVVSGQLIDDKFTLVPNINIIYTTLIKAMDDTLNRLKSVPRWLRTTNVLCPFVNIMGTDESHLPCTYYTHVAKCKDLYDIKKECYSSIRELLYRLQIAVQKYVLYNIIILCICDGQGVRCKCVVVVNTRIRKALTIRLM